jgi:hypothetical protein
MNRLGYVLAEVSREIGKTFLGYFVWKNHDFTPKNYIFSDCGGRRENFWVFRVKNHDFTPKNHIFSIAEGCAKIFFSNQDKFS